MATKNWIKDAIKKPGALREKLGAKAGKSIPAKTLAKAAKAPGKLGTQALQAPADPNALLPKTRSLFRYRGSLTMPPCTENVDWLVFAEPLEVAQADIDVFKLIFPMNARPVQPINRRFLLKGVF